MLRTSISRVALVAALFAASWPLTAAAEDIAAPTFAVELKLDEFAVTLAEPSSAAPVPNVDAPFIDQPGFQLGMPETPGRRLVIANRLDSFSSSNCEQCDDLAARMALRIEDQDLRVSIGARANFADKLGSSGSDDGPARWYMFVAADAQAMSWSFGSHEERESPVRLDDMRLIGDAQAGVGRRVVGGDLAIGYVTREVSHMGADRRENFVGLTFGWDGS
jgi:hypothetical protein